MYCVIKCIWRGNQARVKNADLHHLSCTVVMYKRKSASPVHNVLMYTQSHMLMYIQSHPLPLECSTYITYIQLLGNDLGGSKCVGDELKVGGCFQEQHEYLH
jgi:hypothetical protein